MAERIRTPLGDAGEVNPKFAAGPIEEKIAPEEAAAEPKAEVKKPVSAKKPEELAPGEALEDDTDEGEDTPGYRRENIGTRVQEHAMDPALRTNIADVEKELDASDMVPLLFPVKVQLQDNGLMHIWEPGVHLVPAPLSNHWWLKHNKVRKAGPVVKRQAAE